MTGAAKPPPGTLHTTPLRSLQSGDYISWRAPCCSPIGSLSALKLEAIDISATPHHASATESQGRAAATTGSPDVPPALLKAQEGLWVRSPSLFFSLQPKSGPQPRSPVAGGLLINPTLMGAEADILSVSSPPYCSAKPISKTRC